MPLAKEQPRYTYADYLEWDDDERYELIDGEAYMLAAPSRIHQDISMALSTALYNFLEGKPCKVYAAPFAVRLFPAEDETDDTVVEPDISVVCDSSKLDDRGCKGAPDLIIEIASPSTARYDRIVKFNKYREAGVREYWIAEPEERAVFAYTLKNGEYTAAVYEKTATSAVLPGCDIDLAAIFGTSEAVEA
jgi:Uma2 family endonuclease